VSSTVSVDDHLQACWSSSGAAELGGGRRPNLVRPTALGGGLDTLTSSAAATAAYESTTAAAADQPQDRVPLRGAAAVGSCRRLTSAGLMTLGDGRRP